MRNNSNRWSVQEPHESTLRVDNNSKLRWFAAIQALFKELESWLYDSVDSARWNARQRIKIIKLRRASLAALCRTAHALSCKRSVAEAIVSRLPVDLDSLEPLNNATAS